MIDSISKAKVCEIEEYAVGSDIDNFCDVYTFGQDIYVSSEVVS